MHNLSPELLEKLKKEFKKSFVSDEKIKLLNEALFNNEATYNEANEYSINLGKILADIYKSNLSSEVLPEGKMEYELAKEIIEPTMKQNYELISEYSKAVQEKLNRQAGISIRGIKAPLNEDRINGIVKRVGNEEVFDDIKWILDEPIINFSQSIVDATIKANAEFQSKAGLKPKIVRKQAGNCCDWCREVVGTYSYPDVPKDVYRRHRYCRCTVEFLPGDGRRQNVHTKKWYDPEKDDKIKIRKKQDIQIKEINRKDDRVQYKKYMAILGEDRMPKSLSQFQNLKYDNPVEYEKLKDHVLIQNNFNNGVWKDEINIDKQKRHMQSTSGENKSYFYDDVDVKKLYNEYKMTGKIRHTKGDIKNHEIVDFNESINLGIDIYSGNIANGMTIHYSKTGAHLIPTYHRKE